MSETLSSVEHLVRRHPSGTVLFREGDRGQTMYVIRSGKVNISKRIGDSEITLAMLGAGEFFGEMALLEGLPRSAGATVVEEALLIEVAQGAFATVVRRNSEIAELAGIDERDAAQIVRRVLQARLAERHGSQEGSDAYGTYLALKQRFEYAEG